MNAIQLYELSLRSWRYYVGERLKFRRRSQKKGVGTRRLKYGISRGFAARDGSPAKSHSTTTQYRQLRRLIWAVYSQIERGFYLQVVFNSTYRQLKSFIKFVQKGLFCYGKNESEKHITRQKNTVVINVFIAKKLDFQTVLLF